METKQIISRMIAEHDANRTLYESMDRYYKGDHDILYSYKKFANQGNSQNVIVDNYVNKFINEEVQYSLGNPLNYVPMTEDKSIADAVYSNLFHWKDNHNQELMRVLEIFGKAYLLHYIDAKGRFCERIVSPYQGIEYCDTDDVPQIFIHFYKLKYDETQYRDVYYNDGSIETYKNGSLIAKKKHLFSGVPVTVCKLDRIEDTIYFKIKELQDGYNQILSDQVNTISDYRNAYLVITGALADSDTEKQLREHGIINVPVANGQAGVKWLVKDMPDAYINNMINNLRNAMYSSCNHIDGNEKLQSNTSGTALRNRLVFLEQRCNMMLDIIIDAVYERLARLFEYLAFKGYVYDWHNIKVVANPSIPKDELTTVQMLSQLGIGSNISLETALSLLPFVENPTNEINKINAEREQSKSIELEKLDYEDDEDMGGDA